MNFGHESRVTSHNYTVEASSWIEDRSHDDDDR